MINQNAFFYFFRWEIVSLIKMVIWMRNWNETTKKHINQNRERLLLLWQEICALKNQHEELNIKIQELKTESKSIGKKHFKRNEEYNNLMRITLMLPDKKWYLNYLNINITVNKVIYILVMKMSANAIFVE